MRDYKNDLVSVVTPVYNGEKYIHILLESVLDQTYDKIQMILCDDGSTDNTVEEAEKYRDRFERKGYEFVIVKGNHSCAAGAMCNGLPMVKGEYLIWPDGDDQLLPDSVSRRVGFLRDNADAMCVRTNRVYVDIDTGKEVPPTEKTGNLYPHNIFFEILFGETFVCCGCYMLRSSKFFEIYPDGQIPVYDVGQNFQMLLPYMYFHDCFSVDEPLYKVNRRTDSHSSRSLSEEEEFEKYEKFEHLIDDIAIVAHIEKESEKKRIEEWKYSRRFFLLRKYGKTDSLRDAYKKAYQEEVIDLFTYIKGMVKTTVIGDSILKIVKNFKRGK